MNKKLISLTESDLHRIVKESVNRVLRESSDSVSPQAFGRPEDTMFDGASEEEYAEGEKFMQKAHPWRYNINCIDLASTIEMGLHLFRGFEEGKYSIKNFLSDLYELANGNNRILKYGRQNGGI